MSTAEHGPHISPTDLDATFADTFVASLVTHAPVVLLSAAVPKQGGVGHVNEQWPSYWAQLVARAEQMGDTVTDIGWSERPGFRMWRNGSAAP